MRIEQKAILIDRYTQEWLIMNNKTEAKPKDVMDYLIEKGVYCNDNKDGKPLRDDLRKLDAINKLDLIKGLKIDRKTQNRYWSFVRLLSAR